MSVSTECEMCPLKNWTLLGPAGETLAFCTVCVAAKLYESHDTLVHMADLMGALSA